MLAAALEAEVDEYLEALAGEVDEHGHRLVRRNGRHVPRTITTVAGGIEIHQPRVDDRRIDTDTGEKVKFRSALIPPWCRKSPGVSAVLPLPYLHGMSSGDFVPTLPEFFGTDAGLSPSTITRLRTEWQSEQRAFMNRDLPAATTSTFGRTVCSSMSGSKEPDCVVWSSSVSLTTAPKNS